MLVLFYNHYNRFSFFFKRDFNALEYIQLSYVCPLRKILMFTFFINIPKFVKTFVNTDIACFKLSFQVCMKNYYRCDVWKFPF